jgi:hypothetical protein
MSGGVKITPSTKKKKEVTIMKNLKDFLIGLAIAVGVIALGIGACTLEAKRDADAWRGGICECGGEFEFSNATHRKNGGNYYYYTCKNCGEVIETNQLQKNKSHKVYEVAGVVDKVNLETGCITLIDWDGTVWVYEGTGFEVGQMVIIKLDDSGTNNIDDDKIIEIRG